MVDKRINTETQRKTKRGNHETHEIHEKEEAKSRCNVESQAPSSVMTVFFLFLGSWGRRRRSVTAPAFRQVQSASLLFNRAF